MQVLLATMLIDALHATLEDREITLDRVAVDRAVGQIDVLALAVAGGAMTGEMQLHIAVAAVLVRHDARLAGNVGDHDRHECFGANVIDYHCAGLSAVAIDQR